MSKASLLLQARKIEEYRKLEKPYKKELSGLTITVMPDVYPGGTDSVLLCESMSVSDGDKVLDLCTGNGIVALKTAYLGAKRVVATDFNPAAINNANINAEMLGFDVQFIETDLFPEVNEKFDVITINPPYTDNQSPDKTAICFWDKDNKVVKQFFNNLHTYLSDEGRAYISWSSFADKNLLLELANKNSYKLEQISSRGGKSGFTYYVYQITATA